MRLARFTAAGAERFGVARDGALVDLSGAVADMRDLAAVCAAGQAGRAVIEGWIAGAPRFAAAEVRRLSPVPGRSFRVFCAALNYPAHVEEGGFTAPPEPFIFLKLPESLLGPDDDIVRPGVTRFLDYEGELAVVIGRTARDVAEEEAPACVLGYTVMNEVSARDLQRREENGRRVTDWFSGKALDATSPLGPYIVTADEAGAPDGLHLVTRVNGEVVQETGTDQMIFSVPRLISYISRRVALQPLDVIATGTPAGVGRFRDRRLRHGDVVEVEVSGIGMLRNRVVETEAGGGPGR